MAELLSTGIDVSSVSRFTMGGGAGFDYQSIDGWKAFLHSSNYIVGTGTGSVGTVSVFGSGERNIIFDISPAPGHVLRSSSTIYIYHFDSNDEPVVEQIFVPGGGGIQSIAITDGGENTQERASAVYFTIIDGEHAIPTIPVRRLG